MTNDSTSSTRTPAPSPFTLAGRTTFAFEDGGLIAYPTDTYYGIGCDLLSKKAIDRLYGIKNRDRKKPLAFLCPDLSDVAKYAKVSNFAYRTMRQLTPGPFTFVLEATKLVPDMMMSKQKQVGIRVPQAPLTDAEREVSARRVEGALAMLNFHKPQ